MGTGAAQILAKARSPWVEFTDENNVKLYYNILTTESRRDKPLAVMNEPIEDNKGGGMSAGWSGTWGANMFPDPLDSRTQPRAPEMETAF